MADIFGTRRYSLSPHLSILALMFVFGPTARLSFSGLPTRRHSSHLLNTVNFAVEWSQVI